MYVLYTEVLRSSGTEVRAVPSRLETPTVGALTTSVPLMVKGQCRLSTSYFFGLSLQHLAF
ncbi:MAG: hypothetical protein ACI9NY_000292 [Kiritimatiellia bacterium]|jgi:hypothetical protein